MATDITNFLDSKVINQLGTYSFTATVAGDCVAKISMLVNPPSGMSILIQQNGSTKASASSPAANQQAIDLSVTMHLAISDVVSFVLSSSSPQDNGQSGLNLIKGILNVHMGSSGN